jgi:hypothetical protein
LKFKIYYLRFEHLDKNWKSKNFQNRNIDLKKVFTEETIKIMDTHHILTVKNTYRQNGEGYESCENIFDINKWEKNENFQKPSSLQLRSAHIFQDHLVLLGINLENNFMVKLYSTSSCELLKQSDTVNERGITKWSQIKLSKNVILLFGLNFNEDYDAIHVFDYKTQEMENIQHIKRIVLDLPRWNYLTMSSFDEDFLIGNQNNTNIVQLWDLQNLSWSEDGIEEGIDDGMKAPVIWRVDGSAVCSVVYCHPYAYIGKANGDCDIWDVITNTMVRSLEHFNATGNNIFLIIKKIIVLDHYILTLTQRGKVYVWDKDRCLAVQEGDQCLDERCPPVWTCSSSVSGNVICDLYADTTRLVCLETNTREGKHMLVVKNMWHCYQRRSITREAGTKRKFDRKAKFEKRRKFGFDL